jgi:hypothetical protein
MADIVVVVSGGVLVGLYTDIPNARGVLVDWDEVESSDDLTVAGGLFGADRLASMPDETDAVYKSVVQLD